MVRNKRIWLGSLALALAAMVSAPVHAADASKVTADPSKLFPNDTEIIISINVRQLLDSPLLQKVAMQHAKAALKQEEVAKILKALDFNPLKDIDSIVVTSPGGTDQEKGLVIITGKFEVDKFQKAAEAFAKEKSDELKITKMGNHKVWEISPTALPATLYVLLADKNTIFVAGSKAAFKDALAKSAGSKKAELKKVVATYLKNKDKKQSFSLFATSNAIGKFDIPNKEQIQPILDNFTALSGGVTINKDVGIQFMAGAKNAETAKKYARMADGGLTLVKGLVAVQAMNNPQLEPLIDVLKTVKVAAKGSFITLSGTVSKDLIEKALKMIQ